MPFLRERPERAHAIVICVIEKDVAEAGKIGESEQQSPARRQIWLLRLSSPKAPDQVNEADHHRGNNRDADKRMAKSAMMCEAENPAFDLAEHVQVGRFGGQSNRSCGQRSLAIESGAPQTGAGQEVGKGFQSVLRPGS